MYLKKSLFILSVVLIILSFYPSILISDFSDVYADTYNGYLIQCVDSPYMRLDVRNDQFISLYIMTPEEGYKLIAGESIENLDLKFSLLNISEYTGFANIDAPGLYVVFITTFNQSQITLYDLFVYRAAPHLWIFTIGLILLVVDILIYICQVPRISILLK